VESGRVREGLKGPLNDAEEVRGGCLLVLRHNLLVFITDDARELLCLPLFPLIRHHLTPSLLSSSCSFPPALLRVFCSCLPTKYDQSLFPVRRHDTPFTPTAILEEGLLRQRRVLLATGRMCDIFRIMIIVRSHMWVCRIIP